MSPQERARALSLHSLDEKLKIHIQAKSITHSQPQITHTAISGSPPRKIHLTQIAARDNSLILPHCSCPIYARLKDLQTISSPALGESK